MALDYRYHLASIIAIFVSLLLGLLIGIGLAPNPSELNKVSAELKKEYQETQAAREEELAQAEGEIAELKAVGKASVAGVIADKLTGRRIALVLNHEFRPDFVGDLRGLLTQAGATVISTTSVTRTFVAMPEEERDRLIGQLLVTPSPGKAFRTKVAEAMAGELASVRSGLLTRLAADGLVRTSPGAVYSQRPDLVVFVGGADSPKQASPEQIDAPFIAALQRLGVRVVACEMSTARLSCISHYKAQGATTVDNVDRLAGRLALVLALAGADGHFGTKESADQLLPETPRAR